MRLAWFSPLPPARSGIAAYSAEILPRLGRNHHIDCYADPPPEAPVVPVAPGAPGVSPRPAHDFIWMHRRAPYDLVVHQLGNAPCHDYQWAYLARYPGLVVLHDARLHHARARHLLRQQRREDYRREFHYGHPLVNGDAAEYAVEGLGGNIQYFWPMVRAVVDSARAVAVHNTRLADDLRAEFPAAAISRIRMGVPAANASPGTRASLRRALTLPNGAVVCAAFGKVTAEKRIGAILRALSALVADGVDAYLLLVGDASEYGSLPQEMADAGVADRVRVTGYVADEAVGDYLAAADVCLCLRWPTALETSASWLRCLAAARATVVTDLAHLVDVPALDPRGWQPLLAGREPIAVAVDLLDEDRTLSLALRRLATDQALRDQLAKAGHAYWRTHHGLDAMADDYERAIAEAVARPAPSVNGLPEHFTRDHGERARRIAATFGVRVDILA